MLTNKLLGAGASGEKDMIVEYTDAVFVPSQTGTSFSQTVDTGTTTYSGYTRYVLTIFGNVSAGSEYAAAGPDWSGNAPTLGGTTTTVLATLVSTAPLRMGCVYSIVATNTTGDQTFAINLNADTAGSGVVVFNVFIKGGPPVLQDSDITEGLLVYNFSSIPLSVNEGQNAVFACSIPQNGSYTFSGTAGINQSNTVARGDINSSEYMAVGFVQDVSSGSKSVVTSGGEDAGDLSVLTGIVLKIG